MQLPSASWRVRRRYTVLSLFGRRETSHRIGDEYPRAGHPHADRENHRRDHRGPYSFPRALRKAPRRNAVERARDDEVRALRPAFAIVCERTNRMARPVIPCCLAPIAVNALTNTGPATTPQAVCARTAQLLPSGTVRPRTMLVG